MTTHSPGLFTITIPVRTTTTPQSNTVENLVFTELVAALSLFHWLTRQAEDYYINRIGDQYQTVRLIFRLGLEVPPDQKDFLYYSIIILYLVVLISSLIINLTLLGALISQFRLFFQRPFYVLLVQIIFANLLAIASNLITHVPVITFLDAVGVQSFIKTVPYVLFAAFDAVADQTTQWIVLIIAAHRFFIFLKPTLSYILFEGFLLKIMSVFVWLIAVADAIFLAYSDCAFKAFQPNPTSVVYIYSCNVTRMTIESTADQAFSNAALKVFFAQRAIFPIITVIFYFVVTLKLCCLKKETGTSYNEIQILYQGIFIFIACQIPTAVAVMVYTKEVQLSTAFLYKRMVATGELLSGLLPPLFILVTSREIRSIFKDHRCFLNRDRISPPSSQHSSDKFIK